MKKGTKKADWIRTKMIYRALLERMRLGEVAEMFGVSKQAVHNAVGGRGRPIRRERKHLPHWALPSRADRRQIVDLCGRGMGVREATELLGFKWLSQGPRHISASSRRLSPWDEDWTWRGWKIRWEREVRILIARDALLKGATLRETSEVSGLPIGSLSSWGFSGRLPRSRYRQGYSKHPRLRAPEQSDGASTEEKPR